MPIRSLGRPFLTADELAARWHCRPKTIKSNYQKWGLKPLYLTGRLLFAEDEIAVLEARARAGELGSQRSSKSRRLSPTRISVDE
jgi:hypothetical protein